LRPEALGTWFNWNTIMAHATTPSHQGVDPFFWLPSNSKWNALIGRQGNEVNYLDGYMEAAMELASALIERRMYIKRDTLVMPILYNARHASELLLKFALDKLIKMGVIKGAALRGHNIMYAWKLLQSSELGDEALRQYVSALEPYVSSLSKIDEDGQELRYPRNRAGQKSLASRSLANIEVIRASLKALNNVMSQLKYRLWDLADERATGSYTTKCSRRDLLEIARMLPKRSDWREPAFIQAKAEIMERFSLSGRQFSKAVHVIEGNREMRCLIGLQTTLAYLSDQNALFAVEQWGRLHPARNLSEAIHIIDFRGIDMEAITEHGRMAGEVNDGILRALTPDEIADLETIYYLGRDSRFCEHYESMLEFTKQQHRATGDLAMEVDHLMEKTNFKEAVAHGVSKLGRPDLATRLLGIEPCEDARS
jgi:hypothetical protein